MVSVEGVKRFFNFIDLGVIAVVVVLAVLPPREMYASPAIKADDAGQFAIALAEARTIAHPDDGVALGVLGHKLGDARQIDWAVELTEHGAAKMGSSPSAWRGQLAASLARVDRLDVKEGLDYANHALGICHDQPANCPTWEEIRLSLYQQHLDAGVKSGIDPKKDPNGFRKAGESALMEVHLGRGPSAGSSSK